ncbi:DUF1045 domain-containing protein [Rhizobium daejeonense]
MRYAVYFTPEADHPLTLAASDWLGRDAFSGMDSAIQPVADFSQEERTELTADPRRYGFHATLKAPFTLADGSSETALIESFRDFCATNAAFDIPLAVVNRIGPFFALVPAELHPPLQAFAASIVEAFEPFRAPLGEADIARRRPDRLNEAQRAHLMRWGYPYVMEEFRFHMTLTGPVPEERATAMAEVLNQRFADFIRRPLRISGLALFIEPERGAPFIVHDWQPLAAA